MSEITTVKPASKISEQGRVQISLVGLIVLCVALILTTGLITGFVRFSNATPAVAASPGADVSPSPVPPWGELSLTDVTLEQPEEYVAFDAMSDSVPTWHFSAADPAKVRALLLEHGLTREQAGQAMAAIKSSPDAGGLQIFPNEELLLSLTPEIRARLYATLALNPANRLIKQPYRILKDAFDSTFQGSSVDPATIELVRKLLYPTNGSDSFSDLEFVLARIPDEQTKLNLVKALTRQPAVLARLRIRPDTDIDKVLGYWASGSGARAKDVRPLLEAVKRLHDGSSIGIGYLLPPFAHDRLFTTPVPTKAGDIAEDCHWSALNFFNTTPDDRFADLAFTGKYIDENYYQIAKPSMLGDLVFFLNQEGGAIHSAVHIAADLVFTKNGSNYAQPWILTRMKNLEATYSASGDFQTVYYRRKEL